MEILASARTTGPTAYVVGAGVIGLTTAVRLLELGLDVTILTREPIDETTSHVAGAYWHPFAVAPKERVLPWARITYRVARALAEHSPDAGVAFRTLYKYYPADEVHTWWMNAAPSYEQLPAATLPPTAVAGYKLTVPVMDSRYFLPYLVAQVRTLGGRVEQRTLHHLDELYGAADLLVNCSGLGAASLNGDTTVQPIRGQVLRVKAPAGMERAVVSFDKGWRKTYIVPRTDDCILGGTADAADADTTARPADAEAFVERCIQLRPALRNAEWLEHRVGLRPGRPEIRLETEHVDGQAIIHNYGHGGAGYTVCWGCAASVAEEAVRVVGTP